MEYDNEWLAILEATQKYFPFKQPYFNIFDRLHNTIKVIFPQKDHQFVQETVATLLKERDFGNLRIPENFTLSVEPFNPTDPHKEVMRTTTLNVQTKDFAEFAKLDITKLEGFAYEQEKKQDKVEKKGNFVEEMRKTQKADVPIKLTNEEELKLDDFDFNAEPSKEVENGQKEKEASVPPRQTLDDLLKICEDELPFVNKIPKLNNDSK